MGNIHIVLFKDSMSLKLVLYCIDYNLLAHRVILSHSRHLLDMLWNLFSCYLPKNMCMSESPTSYTLDCRRQRSRERPKEGWILCNKGISTALSIWIFFCCHVWKQNTFTFPDIYFHTPSYFVSIYMNTYIEVSLQINLNRVQYCCSVVVVVLSGDESH